MQVEELQEDMLTSYVQRFFNKVMCFLVLDSDTFLPLYIHIYSENCTCKCLLIET